MSNSRERPPSPYDHLPDRPQFTVVSEDFTEGDVLPMVHAYDGVGGGNLSPQLTWFGFPEETKGFAVVCYDPDAPNESGWWHWLLTGLPLDCTMLAQGAGAAEGSALPSGSRQHRNDYGTYDYGGAAPPPGDHYHRYYFTVYALDTDDLGLPADPSPAVVAFTLNAHALARAHLTATFDH